MLLRRRPVSWAGKSRYGFIRDPADKLSYTDSLSLAMFEALRGLRDAVAPESGNIGQANTHEGASPDMDELWALYKRGDPTVVAMVTKANGSAVIQKREDFIRVHAKMEMEKDSDLVMRLASTVLEKSLLIDEGVDSLPGMDRTKDEQMKRIEELVQLNAKAARDLETAYVIAKDKRDTCREFIRNHTCEALGIQEESQ